MFLSRTIQTLFAAGLLLAPVAAQADDILVYLQGGQSNADGRAPSSGLPTSPVNLQQPQDDVAFFRRVENTIHPLTTLRPGLSETGGFGPEITFGRDMADYYAGSPNTSVAIIKYANGGTNLHTQWTSGGDATTTGDGAQYIRFQETVTAGMAAIAAANPGDNVTIAGMIWHQGESDAGSSSTAQAYQANLTAFIADVRATYGANLPFVIGEIADNGGNYTTIRNAQAAVAAADPLNGFVDVDTFALQDSVHFNASGQMDLGSGFAAQMQAIPEPSSLALLGLSGLLVLRRRR